MADMHGETATTDRRLHTDEPAKDDPPVDPPVASASSERAIRDTPTPRHNSDLGPSVEPETESLQPDRPSAEEQDTLSGFSQSPLLTLPSSRTSPPITQTRPLKSGKGLDEPVSSKSKDRDPRPEAICLVFEFLPNGHFDRRQMSFLEIVRYARDHAAAPHRWSTSRSAAADENVVAAPVKNFHRLAKLHSRDIRELDLAGINRDAAAIIVRRNVILLHLEPFRAIILRDRCLIIPPAGADDILGLVLERLQQPYEELDDSPEHTSKFEFLAVDTIVDSIVRHLQLEYMDLQPKVHFLLSDAASMRPNMMGSILHKVRDYKNRLSALCSTLSAMKNAMESVLEKDDELAGMNLTDLCQHVEMGQNPHAVNDLRASSENLLDAHLIDVDALSTRAGLLQQHITNAEQLLALRLDTARNIVLNYKAFLNMLLAIFAFGGQVAAIFGMNLTSGHEEDAGWFRGVVLSTVLVQVLITAFFAIYFYKRLFVT